MSVKLENGQESRVRRARRGQSVIQDDVHYFVCNFGPGLILIPKALRSMRRITRHGSILSTSRPTMVLARIPYVNAQRRYSQGFNTQPSQVSLMSNR